MFIKCLYTAYNFKVKCYPITEIKQFVHLCAVEKDLSKQHENYMCECELPGLLSLSCSAGLIHTIVRTRSKNHIRHFWEQNEAACLPVHPEPRDIRFLPAGRCHLDTSLHPHILTFCKHVWLYQLTLPPSGRCAQAKGRHAPLMCKLTVWPPETLAMPTSIFPCW